MAPASLRSYRIRSLLIGAACLAAGAGLAATPLGRGLELVTVDLRFALRGPIPESEEILLVDIDDASLAELGQWPWSRRLHAELAQGLTLMGASTIVFDVEFLDATDDDEGLARAFEESGRVYLPIGFRGDAPRPENPWVARSSSARAPQGLPDHESLVLPVEPLVQQGVVKRFGSVDVPDPDPDGIYRRTPLAFRHGDRMYLHLGTVAAMDALGADPTSAGLEGGALTAGRIRIPVDAEGRSWINWARTGRDAYVESFRHLPYVTALRAAQKFLQGEMAADSPYVKVQQVVEGRIVFVGAFGRSFGDRKPAPNSPNNPGVSLHSNVANMILTEAYLAAAPAGLGVLAGLALGAGAIALCVFARPLAAAGGVALAVALWVGACATAFSGGTVLPAVLPSAMALAPFAGILPYRLATEERTRGRIVGTFERFLHPDIVREILADPEVLREDARRIRATVMFTDIEGFSGFAETTPPEVTVKVLNVYLTLVTGTVVSYQGYLDKYLGDGTMSIFGLRPGLDPALSARNACRAAAEIRARTAEQAKTYPFGRTRIGIASGEIVSGFIGGVQGNLDYTGIGDVVNVAARLQAMNKETGTSILIDERTRELLGDAVDPKFVDTVTLRGRKEPVKIFSLEEAP